MVGSIIAVLALGVVYEGLKSLREFLMMWDELRRGRKGNVHIQLSNETTPLVGKRIGGTSW